MIEQTCLEQSPLFQPLKQLSYRIYWRLKKQEQRWQARTVHGTEPYASCDSAFSELELQFLLDTVSPLECQVLTLIVVEGYTERESGALLGCSKTCIHAIKMGALEKLRVELNG